MKKWSCWGLMGYDTM